MPARPRPRRGRSVPRRWHSLVTSRLPPRCAPPSTASQKPSAASISWCRTRAPPGRGASARWTRPCCAGASSSTSTATNAWPKPQFASCSRKAPTLFLVRQYALDYGTDGIRANAVNADRIRSGLLTDEFVRARAKARGVSEKEYMSGNLLGREVTADDVAQAFLHQALELKTTGDVTTVDGGNIAAALR